MIEHKDNWFIRFLKRVGIITTYKVDKAQMCKEGQRYCDHCCDYCAWGNKND